ncbi:PspC domain-containing protein [Neptunomonas sp. XY-337]|uniref:PspC domain-containing protein n=1 Tax=Neptunomonas sp. XY-337 TaxID=2561897 RepID=UPI0010AA9711|nr:PspC domain-containing protein [Neptunomonas sp. XY-337]
MFSAKYRGYDIDLYRSTRSRWIGGVCAGIAENMNWSAGGVRLAIFILFMFTGPLVIFGYIAAVFLLASRPSQQTYQAEESVYRPNANLKDKVLDKSHPASARVAEIRARMASIDQRIRRLEEHVTSRKFQFDRELRRSL